jgi:integration host factor subunit beta
LTQALGSELFVPEKSAAQISTPRQAMSTNLTKREIVLEIYEKTGFPQKQIQDTVQMTLDIVMDALAAGRNVELRNFGVLEVQVRKARVGRNPNKPETEVVIPERAVVKFKSGKILKQKIKALSLEKLKANPPPPASAD